MKGGSSNKRSSSLLASMFEKKLKSQETSSSANRTPTQASGDEVHSFASLNTPFDESDHDSNPSPQTEENEIRSRGGSNDNASPLRESSNANASPLGESSNANASPLGKSSNANASPLGESSYDVDLLPHDPGKRISIVNYPPNVQDAVRRAYILRGPCQPKLKPFPSRLMGKEKNRRFSAKWYDKHNWIEYSVEKDAAFCFVCYLFKNETATKAAGGDGFVSGGGFRCWNKPKRLVRHEGKVNSAHMLALQKFETLKNSKSSIIVSLDKQPMQAKIEYRARLKASLQCLRYLLRQGLAIRGHRENDDTKNKGNFLELLQWLAEIDDRVGKVVLKNAPGNLQLTCHSIQSEIINACAKETTKAILHELGDDYFGILADESIDMAMKEQLALCLRFVDRNGKLVERFLGLVHVKDTSALTLKAAIESLLMKQSLNLSKIRGQGYDGASNMSGQINGLKTLIMRDNPCAYYVHCFAHQLQLTLVAVAKSNDDCIWFFYAISILLNLVGGSCKRTEMINENQIQRVGKALQDGELETGKGLNQEIRLSRPVVTRWGSHHKTLMSIINLYPGIFGVLLQLGRQAQNNDRAKAQGVLYVFEQYDFILMLHLMYSIFGMTHQLNIALQRSDQDIVNAMSFVTLTKVQLQNLRDRGWEDLAKKVSSFCTKYHVEIPDMGDPFVPRGRSKRFVQDYTNAHHYKHEVFNAIIDKQLTELNDRFDEASMELLLCMACFNPNNSFSRFDKQKLLRLAEFYPNDFSSIELLGLDFQLDNFIVDMRMDERFSNVKDLGELSLKLVEIKKHVAYSEVYKLLKLVLILPVATASVERVFSGMKIVKNRLWSSMGDPMLNDCLVTFIESDTFLKVADDDIINRFQNMKTRRGQL